MASTTDKMTGKKSETDSSGNSSAGDDSTKSLEKDIAKTRSHMSETLGALQGKLNPEALKDQALDQFHEAKASITADLIEAKDAIKADLKSEIDEIKHGLRNELMVAKEEFREATVGKVEHMVQNTRDTVNQTSKSLLETLSDNPIPTAIVGIGLGWLFINARAKRQASQRTYGVKSYENGRSFTQGGDRYDLSYGGRVHSVENRVEEYAQQAAHKAGDVAHSLGDGAKRVASSAQNAAKQAVKGVADQAGSVLEGVDAATHGARDNITQLAHNAQDRVGNYAHQVSDYANQAGTSAMQLARDARQQAGQLEGRIERTLRENPLPVGAVALALGLAVGLSIPSTKVEDEWMGDARDKALDGAEAYAHQAIGQLESAATKLVDGNPPSKNGESAKTLSQHS